MSGTHDIQSETVDVKKLCALIAYHVETTPGLTKRALWSLLDDDLLEAYRLRGHIERKFLKTFGPWPIHVALGEYGSRVVAKQLRQLAN